MSQRTVSSFVPFEPGSGATDKSGGAGFTPTVVTATEGTAGTALRASSSSHPSHQHAGSEVSAKPVVTLQRVGDKITSIRIECICGQIVDLACSY